MKKMNTKTSMRIIQWNFFYLGFTLLCNNNSPLSGALDLLICISLPLQVMFRLVPSMKETF